MKNSFIFLVLFFLCKVLFAQENEPLPVKGQMMDNPILSSIDAYETISTVYLTKMPDNQWTANNWHRGAASSGFLFSTGKYENNARYWLESPDITLPKLLNASERLNLYLDEWYQLESYHDEGKVKISGDEGRTWQVVSIRSGRSDKRTSVINLTAYAGKAIRLGFELATDVSHAYQGWDISGIHVKHERLSDRTNKAQADRKNSSSMAMARSTLGGTLTSLDAQKFPRFIFANLTVTEGGISVDSLDESNFSVIETIQDSTPYSKTVVKDETFKVYSSAGDSSAKRPVDILFLMDNSGSMSDEQAQVAANVNNFVMDLDSRGFEYRLALCRFGQGANQGKPIFYNNAGWYTNANDFVTMWRAVNTVDGGIEPSWDALYYSSQQYSFASGAQKIFILITDESITNNNLPYSDIKDRQLVIDRLQSAGITTYALTMKYSPFDYDFGAIADSTGGRWYNILSPFNDILDDIGTQVTNTYTVRYTPTKPDFDGLRRDVEINLTFDSKSLTLNGDYTPGAAPMVFRTDTTLALHKKTQEAKVAVTIEVMAEDRISPYTQSVFLYYRTVNTSTYKELRMVRTGGSSVNSYWQGRIPEGDVLAPGIQYYVRASDGQSTTTAPEFIDQEGYPWSFAVWPNLPPTITNRTITSSLKPGNAINFRAEAYDNTDRIDKVWVYVFRPGKDVVKFKSYQMTELSPGLYGYDGMILEQGITEYFFVAEDNHGISDFEGSELNPYVIATDIPWSLNTNASLRHTINLAGIDVSTFTNWSVNAKLGDEALDIGDFIGVFYRENVCDAQNNCAVVDKCSGYYSWRGQPSGFASFLVYGDNPATPEKEGFAAGESFLIKIYRKKDQKVYDAEHVFRTSSPDRVFKQNGSSQIQSINGFYAHLSNVQKNLNLWSTYLTPKEASFSAIFAPYANQVREIWDDKGNYWKPNDPSSTLTTYVPGYGYELYMPSGGNVEVKGSRVDLNKLRIGLVGNYQSTLIGCPYESAESVEAVFNNYKSNVYVVDKYVNDGTGFVSIESYSPMFEINNWVDKNMRPGEGYFVFAVQPEPSFSFPAPKGSYVSARMSTAANTENVEEIPQLVRSTESYMHVVLPVEAWSFAPESGNEVRAYDMKGNQIGKARVRTSGALLVLDGWGMQQGTTFELRFFSSASNSEEPLNITAWSVGEGVYKNHQLAVAKNIEMKLAAAQGGSMVIYPNPTKELLKIAFKMEEPGQVEFSITNVRGQKVLSNDPSQYPKGQNTILLDIRSLDLGIYFIKIKKGKLVETKKIVIE